MNIINIGYGAVCGWPSPSLILLQSDDSPLRSGPITVEEASWIGAMMCVGGLTGTFLFGWITNRYGRKISLCLLAIPQFVCISFKFLCDNLDYM